MSKYNDIVTFNTDKKDKSSTNILKKAMFILIAVIIVIILLIVFIISLLNKNIDLTLNSLSVDSGIISPEFSSNNNKYIIETDSDTIFFTCKKSSDKVKVSGCDRTIKLNEEENNINIIVSYKSRQNKYNFKVIKNSKFDILVSGNSEEWTDKDITLSINASSLEGVPLAQEAYSFDDGDTWQKENKKTFVENQNIYIRVRDEEGNISSRQKIVIDKIDKNVPSVKISVNKKKLTAIVEPSKTPSGYTYVWYVNGEKINNSNKINYTVKKSGNYKVEVINGLGKTSTSEEVNVTTGTTYTIKYNANGGTDAPSDQIKVKDEDLIITDKKPIKTGYDFKGWSTSSDGNVDYESNDKYTSNKSLVLYAVWQKSLSVEKYNISYDGTGGSNVPGSQEKEKDKTLTLSSTIPTKANYSFLGWSTVNGGNVEYKAGSSYSENKSVTLYAVWQKMKTITVTYNGNGAKVNKSSVSNSGTTTFTLPSIIRDGYTILGWSTNPTATTATYKVGQKVVINDSITLYAITTKKLTATFNKNKASSISKTSASCNLYNTNTLCIVVTPTIQAPSGKQALGWSTSSNSKTANFAQNSNVAISNNTTMYAIIK